MAESPASSRHVVVRRVVAASGAWNIVLGAMVAVPAMDSTIGIRSPDPLWRAMFVGILLYAGMVLMLASRNLVERAAFVCWGSVARMMAAGLLMALGGSTLGPFATVLAVSDGVWAVVLLCIVPWAVQRPMWSILLDRRSNRPNATA